MKLNIPERIALLNVIPREGNVVTLKIVRELQGKLSFTEEEMKRFKLTNTKHPDGTITITWDEDFSTEEADIEIGEVAMGIIKGNLKKLNEDGQLKMEMLSLYEKFVEGAKA